MPKHSLLRLTQSLYSTPHLISQSSFENIVAYLEQRNKGNMMLPVGMPDDKEDDMPDDMDDMDPEMGIGVIEVMGPLTNRSTGWEAMCGGCSYEGIIDQLEEMIEAGCKSIVLHMDSGGGEAYGVFECADTMRKKCDEAGVKLYAYNDGCCASACYALACAADEVISNPYAETGSIGVLIALMDKSKYLEMEGLKPVFISAGKEKIPYANDGSFKDSFLADLQMKVDTLYESFVDHVAKYTAMTKDQIKGTEAKTFVASEALSIGLVNKVLTRSEFVQYVMDKQQGGM